MALEIWGWLVNFVSQGGGALGADVQSAAVVTSRQPPAIGFKVSEAPVVLYYQEHMIVNDHDPGAGFALSAYKSTFGHPQGMFPTPVVYAGDRLFCAFNNANSVATSCQFKLFVRPIEVSLEEWLDIQETFK